MSSLMAPVEAPKGNEFQRIKREVEDTNPISEESYIARIREIENTPDFKEWFGQSEMVDLAGRPLILLHGTPKKFTSHQEGGVGNEEKVDPGFFGEGHYFTLDKDIAEQYASDDFNERGYITYSYCNAEKVLTFDTPLVYLTVSKDTAEEVDLNSLPFSIRDRVKELFFEKVTGWRAKQEADQYSWTAISTPENSILFPFLSNAVKTAAIEKGYSAGRGISPKNSKVEYVVFDDSTLKTVRRRVVKVLDNKDG